VSTHGPAIRHAPWMLAALVALPALHAGCASPTAPPEPPGGGTTLQLNFAEFEQSVEPIIVRQGCDATGDCHGGGIRGSLQLSPPGAKDAQFDFDQIVLQVSATAPTASPVLTEPLALAAGGTPHAYKPFPTTSDPDYQTIRGWIMAGVTP
jgi:hypothetical protein